MKVALIVSLLVITSIHIYGMEDDYAGVVATETTNTLQQGADTAGDVPQATSPEGAVEIPTRGRYDYDEDSCCQKAKDCCGGCLGCTLFFCAFGCYESYINCCKCSK